jgi:hypothetical protein
VAAVAEELNVEIVLFGIPEMMMEMFPRGGSA